MFKSPCVCVHARWVSGLEAVAPLLNKGLSYLLHVSKKKRKCENFCFLPVSQHKHVTGSLQPPHGLFWVKGSSLCCCPFCHSLVFLTISLVVRLMYFVIFTGLHSVILFAVNMQCFSKGMALCKFPIIDVTAVLVSGFSPFNPSCIHCSCLHNQVLMDSVFIRTK